MSSFQEVSGNKNLYDEFHLDTVLPPQLQDNDGNMQIMDANGDPQMLYEQQLKSSLESLESSYTFSVKEDCGTTYSACQEKTLSDEEMNRSILGEVFERWFKITIPNGKKYNKMWLINLLQSYCSMGFTPVDFQYIRNGIQFFVQSTKTAVELMNINYQISDEENKKISIYVNSSSEPASVHYKLTAAQMHSLKLSMKKRYDVSKKALYLGKLRFDQDLMDHGIDMFLNRRSCMTAALQIIQENFPELLSLNVSNNKIYWLDGLSELIEKAPHVKTLNLSRNLLRTAWELEKIRGLNLEQLWLEGNPLCSTFPDHSSYVSAILNYFPELSHLVSSRLHHFSSPSNTRPPSLLPSPVCLARKHVCSRLLSKKNMNIFLREKYPISTERRKEERGKGDILQMSTVISQPTGFPAPFHTCLLFLFQSLLYLLGHHMSCPPSVPLISYFLQDGRKLFPTIDINTLEIIKPRKESYKGSECLKNLLVQFMLQYYLIYDYGDRHSLLNAYHANACFSLAITFNSDKADMSSLEDYLKDNRNMKMLTNSFLRMQLLKHKKYNIVTCLHELPKTQHDLNSYVVDICVQTEKMICFSVNGVFKEVEGKSWGSVRAFTRTFILTPDRHFRLCIVNDEMILRNANPAEARKAFSTTRPTVSYTQSCWNTHTDLKYCKNKWKCIREDEALFTFQSEERSSSEFFRYKF
ncbi:nuclear RNA export factor 2-like [Rattus norvegicus]|uniref:nuclear RNA export factor 2-like n=1 Tax=Rattus norvegicus TaxID=10116 RepID=UPI002FD84A8C